MKILLYTDPHFCQYSSILRKRGLKYSQRLENLITSIDWAENLAKEQHCDKVICLGDFFDKPVLNDEELTALQDIKWCDLPHTFIVGNHESSVNGLRYNSVNTLASKGFDIVYEPRHEDISDTLDILYLPYITEDNREPLSNYIKTNKHHIILSHNDIKGIQYGKIASPIGFDLKEIADSCVMFLNGHLHNGMFLNKNKSILNLGNLTGQNFGEDAGLYDHQAVVLDTDNLTLAFFENPYAYNFYKLEVDSKTDINKMIADIKNNAILSFKCSDKVEKDLRKALEPETKIIDYRITTYKEEQDSYIGEDIIINNVDHLEQFKKFILENLGSSNIVKEELQEVCRG